MAEATGKTDLSVAVAADLAEFKSRVVDIKDYGAVGGGATDNSTAILAAIAAAEAQGTGATLYIPLGSFAFSSTLVLTPFLHAVAEEQVIRVRCDGHLLYTGASTQPAIVIGNPAKKVFEADLQFTLSRGGGSDWSDPEGVGVRLININTSNIRVDLVYGFYTGIELTGDADSASYNNFVLGRIRNNKYGIDLHPQNSGWVNENTFMGGQFGRSYNPAGEDCYGVRLGRNGATYRVNNAVFFKPSFEMRGDLEGDAYGMSFERAQENRVYRCRTEGNTKLAIFDNDSYDNVIEVGTSGPGVPGKFTDNSSVGNTVVWTENGVTNHLNTFTRTPLSLEGGLALAETTTPTPIADSGQIYTKSDNLVYFQDGAGSEHKITLASGSYEDLIADAVAHFKLDETGGTVAANEQGTDAIYTNIDPATDSVAGLHPYTGTAIAFDGVDQYVAGTNDPPMTAAGTISVWTDCVFGTLRHVLVSKGLNTQVQFTKNTGSQLVFRVGANNGNDVEFDATGETGVHHWVCTWEGTTGKMYRDGVEVASGTINAASADDPLKLWTIGQFDSPLSGYYPNGTFDEVLIFDRALTTGEIALLGLDAEHPAITLKETTTPTADAGFGKIYTKSDDKLYFQDGAGTEHELAFV